MPIGSFASVALSVSACIQALDNTRFPDTKANHWVYAALAKQGSDRFAAWRSGDEPPTRSDVLDAIVKEDGWLKGVGHIPTLEVTDLNSWIKELGAHQTQNPPSLREGFDAVVHVLTQISTHQLLHEEIEDEKRLLDAFSTELAARGLSSKEMKNGLSIVDKRLILHRKTAKDLDKLNAPFLNNEKQHWAYEAITRLKTDGILIGRSTGQPESYFFTRLEFVLNIHAAYSKLNRIMEDLGLQIDQANVRVAELRRVEELDDNVRQKLKAEFREMLDEIPWIGNYERDARDLKQLLYEFAPNASALGLDVNEMQHNLDTVNERVSVMTKSSSKFSEALK